MKKALVLFAIVVAGCSGGEFPLAPVSGTVTYDGEPLEGAEVVFAPMESSDTIEVGPASVGITDAEGKYTLKTVRGKQPGAVVTKHRVSVGFGEVDEVAIAAKVEAVNEKNRNMSSRELKALQKKILKSMDVKKTLPDSYNRSTRLKFEVEGPTDNADFNLNSDGS